MDNEEEPEPKAPEEEPPIPQPPTELRIIGLIGEVDEKKSEDIIYALLMISSEGEDDVDMYISSTGGAALDMFSIYDVMRLTKAKIDISTIGIGKVMSAAVILMAAGTKGKRKVAKNCRVMLHTVIAGTHGTLHDLENEMEEVKYTQEKYIEILCKETKLTRAKLKKMFARNVNVYLSAEEAVEYGIADEVI
jgi:ATP-dependent Clp protease protease subunit|tara:strand:+ start:970 stop:1545 length:576 start_codon:yes stop_codon:yes gene_type:complete